MQQSVRRLLVLVLLIPICLRELIALNIDVGNYFNNVNTIHAIISYDASAAIKAFITIRVSHMWIAYVGASCFILMHALLLIGYIMGIVLLVKFRSSERYKYVQQLIIAITMCNISLYILLFAFISMFFFQSWMQGMDYTNVLVLTVIPCIVVLFYTMNTE